MVEPRCVLRSDDPVSVKRLRQAGDLLRPTIRAISWYPPLWAAGLALIYVAAEARSGVIDYRITVLRLGALLLCMGSVFVLDDATEETIGHVPTPLLLRRALRIALLLPLISTAWAAMLYVAGEVSSREGGPMPRGDLTLEAATLLAIAFCAASLAARFTSDRLGGIAAAPIVLVLFAIGMFLPEAQKMFLGSPSVARWADAHEWWRALFLFSVAIFVWLNRPTGAHRRGARMRALRGTPRTA